MAKKIICDFFMKLTDIIFMRNENVFKRKSAKTTAKHTLKKHYWIMTAACLIAGYMGVEYVSSFSFIKTVVSNGSEIVENVSDGRSVAETVRSPVIKSTITGNSNWTNVLYEIVNGNAENSKAITDEYIKNSKQNENKYFEAIEMGRRAGVFAQIANTVSSGSLFVTVYSSIKSITGNENGAIVIFVIISFLVILAAWTFIFNVYTAIYKRIFLESRIYEKVNIKSFIHFIRIRKYCKASVTMLVKSVFQLLWSITVIGGFVKSLSYFMVPYIVAENPDISPLKAITLSRKMMKGHKLECLIMKLSFLPWTLLETVTFGFMGIFFLNPYIETVGAEYYAYIRAAAKENGIENAELLNDKYLFEKADKNLILENYQDIIALENEQPVKKHVYNKVWKFFADVFGTVPLYNETEKEYEAYNIRKIKVSAFKNIMAGSSYPGRLNPIPEKKKLSVVENINYMRHYSVCSLIIMFFMFSFIGWFWEVCFHLIEDGEFVNRGVLHGPWLPIYGSGTLLILLGLNRLRSKPVILFIASIILCGTVEYFTGMLLEMKYGEKWWDYSGYFLNINGRVCAEGLLVFGIGGMAFVYFIAPLTDNILKKIRMRYILPICIVLLIAFVTDQIYSASNPNSGDGITKYEVPSAYSYSIPYDDEKLFI